MGRGLPWYWQFLIDSVRGHGVRQKTGKAGLTTNLSGRFRAPSD